MLYVTVDDISVMYVTANRFVGGWRMLDLNLGALVIDS